MSISYLNVTGNLTIFVLYIQDKMKIFLNNAPVNLSGPDVTLLALIQERGISRNGTAVSVNDRLIRQIDWETTKLKDGDRIVIISAAFGG